jgi:hypothetical protein
MACQEFTTQLGRNFQVSYRQANAHGQPVQTAGNTMTSTDTAAEPFWAGFGPSNRCEVPVRINRQ